MHINFPTSKKKIVLALGAESAGNFSVFCEKKIYLSENFGDLLEEKNWENYRKKVLEYLKKIKPQIVLTDLHPLFKTTLWGKELAQKYKALFIQIQHHHAHIFSAIGERFMNDTSYVLPNIFYGIACDGTGYGLDQKIWGGEAFAISNFQVPISNKKNKLKIQRIGHLENQILIGEDLAIKEPARMLISILDKFLKKKEIFNIVKKHYSQNEFELLYNQFKQNFRCSETSSAGRVLDATSILLDFCKNERKYKHQPIELLEKNSTKPYLDLKPKITKDKNGIYVLNTTHLFNYVINRLQKKDKKRLASTAQLYIAEGLCKIIKLKTKNHLPAGEAGKTKAIFIAGGITSSKIISDYLISKGAYASKKISHGDAGLSFGQIIYYLLEK